MAIKRDIRNELAKRTKKDTIDGLKKMYVYISSVNKSIFKKLFAIKFILTFLPIISLYLFQEIVNDAMKGEINYNLIIGISILMIVDTIIDYFASIVDTHFSNEVNYQCSIDVQKKVNSLEIRDFEDKEIQNNLNRANQATYTFKMYTHKIINLFFNFVSIFSYVVILLTFNFGIVLIAILPIAYLVFEKTKVLKENFITRWEMSETRRKRDYYRMILSNDPTLTEIKVLNVAEAYYKKFEKAERTYRDKTIEMELKYIESTKNIELVQGITSTSYYTFLIWNLAKGIIQVGNFNTYRQAFSTIISQTENILYTVSSFESDSIEINEFFRFIEFDNNYKDGKLNIKQIDSIEFRDVSFRYKEDSRLVLENVSFTIDKGKNTAFIGPNGSGKTTVMKLIEKIYEPTTGEIFINGINLKEYKTKSIRDNIAVLLQDYAIYQETVKENIMLDRHNKSDKSAYDLIAYADLKTRIKEMPQKINTILGGWFGEGINLSTGQRQKMALSRIFARDAKLLLLDEPNSALDPRSEKEMFSFIQKNRHEKTCVVTLHVFTNIDMMDNIIMFEEGKIIANGEHKILYKENIKYKEFYDLQERDEEDMI